mmetsp:Transcript_61786/g.163792  ORF Transcript_61786/g.163792 Transcript_61786/m.163792 type:complete len:642 (+) Transcript_61786:81-2006(+)
MPTRHEPHTPWALVNKRARAPPQSQHPIPRPSTCCGVIHPAHPSYSCRCDPGTAARGAPCSAHGAPQSREARRARPGGHMPTRPVTWPIACRSHVHARVGAAHRGGVHALVGLLDVGDERGGGEDGGGDGARVEHRLLCDRRRVDDAHLQEVAVRVGRRVPAVAKIFVADALEDDGTLGARVGGDLDYGRLDGAVEDVDGEALVIIGHLRHHLVLGAQHVDEGGAAPRHDALCHRRLDRVERVLVAQLLVLELRLRRGAHLDPADRSSQLGDALLGLLLVELGVAVLKLGANLLDALGDGVVVLAGGDHGAALLGHGDARRRPQHLRRDRLEREPELLRHECAARQRRNVLEVARTPLAKAGRLDRAHLEHAAHLVEHERRERLARHVLCDDEQRVFGLDEPLEQRHELVHILDLAVGDEDLGVGELARLQLLVLHKVRRDVPAVDLHPLGEVDLVHQRLAILDHRRAVGAHTLEARRDRATHRLRPRRDRRHVLDVLVVGDRLGHRLDFGGEQLRRLLQPTLEAHRVGARGDELEALAHQRLRQHRRRRRAVARFLVRLRRHLHQQLCADIRLGVLELDVARDGHSVVDDLRHAVAPLKHHVATLGPQRHLDRVRDRIYAREQRLAARIAKGDLRRHADG